MLVCIRAGAPHATSVDFRGWKRWRAGRCCPGSRNGHRAGMLIFAFPSAIDRHGGQHIDPTPLPLCRQSRPPGSSEFASVKLAGRRRWHARPAGRRTSRRALRSKACSRIENAAAGRWDDGHSRFPARWLGRFATAVQLSGGQCSDCRTAIEFFDARSEAGIFRFFADARAAAIHQSVTATFGDSFRTASKRRKGNGPNQKRAHLIALQYVGPPQRNKRSPQRHLRMTEDTGLPHLPFGGETRCRPLEVPHRFIARKESPVE